jgi:epsilon-lactone hydrolase
MADDRLHVPAREIPVPEYLSEEARACLAAGPSETTAPWPPLDDADAWRERIAWQDNVLLALVGGSASTEGVAIEDLDVDGARVYVVTPDGVTEDNRVYLDIHGGALILGSGECCRALGVASARRYGVKTWAVDYRMPPEHPYPTPLDDCVNAYRSLLRLHDPADVIVGGGSAGANLAAALILRARDEGLPLPAAAVLMSPELDLTESGDTFRTNLGVDTVIGRFTAVNLLYAAGHDLSDPYLSPLFGDFTKGFPPTLLTAGTRDLFLSNAVRMHRSLRRAGVEAELHVLEAAPHGGFFGSSPEEADVGEDILRFANKHWTP